MHGKQLQLTCTDVHIPVTRFENFGFHSTHGSEKVSHRILIEQDLLLNAWQFAELICGSQPTGQHENEAAPFSEFVSLFLDGNCHKLQ